MIQIQKMVSAMTRYTDLILAFMIVAVIALMILPLPTPIVDTLIAMNLGMAIVLLMLSLYIPSALSLSTFPTLLLFTTLFRLALNITTTRQILLNAYAGKIIETFGHLVVSGNFIVGGVIFLIITIVQFLVIAKGAERVAEVGARFTLDAMPGKQMSIDADLRAGTIEMETARKRRQSVEKESQLYGAMDGAMKFVKGDAIAGLVVTVINILGGIAIGMLQKDMTAMKALQTYSILTIGDGLISQLPALFISITAGIIVTRVSTEDSPHLGGDIGRQILTHPKALYIAGIILFSFALIPGFPKPQFMILGLMVGGVGFSLYRNGERQGGITGVPGIEGDAALEEEQPAQLELSLTEPIRLEISSRLGIDEARLNKPLARLRTQLYMALGVPLPNMTARVVDMDDDYAVLFHEVGMARGELPDSGLALSAVHAAKLNEADVPIRGELKDAGFVVVEESSRGRLEAMGLEPVDTVEIMIDHLEKVLRRNAGEFLGLQETRLLLDRVEQDYAVLVKEVLRILPIPKITDVLRRLVQEDLSIRNMRAVLEVLIEWAPKEKDVVMLTEHARVGLKRYISYKYSGENRVLPSYMLEPDLEETIRKSVRQTAAGSFLALDPNASKRIVEKVRAEIDKDTADNPVLLSSMDIRRYVRSLLEKDVDLPVLSFQELTPDISIHPLAKISA